MITVLGRKFDLTIRELLWPKIFAILSFAKIDLAGIPTVKNLPKINSASKLQNFRKTVTKTTENLNKNKV